MKSFATVSPCKPRLTTSFILTLVAQFDKKRADAQKLKLLEFKSLSGVTEKHKLFHDQELL
jgi:hypothetical protein